MSRVKGRRNFGALRHKMSRRLFFVLPILLLSLFFCMCGFVSSCSTLFQGRAVNLFISRRAKLRGDTDGVSSGAFEFFRSPFVFGADGMIVALADAHFAMNNKLITGVTARYIETEGDVVPVGPANVNGRDQDSGACSTRRVTNYSGENWKTQLALGSKTPGGDCQPLRKLVAVARGNKIYLFTVSETCVHNAVWEFGLVVGEIKGEVKGEREINWKTFNSTFSNLAEEFKRESLNVNPNEGWHAFLTKDGEVVFAVKTYSKDGRAVALIRLTDTGDELRWDWFPVKTPDDCYSFPVFGWGEKILMVPTHCWYDKKVKESTDVGRTWRDTTGPFSRLWDSLKDKEDFTTATIGNKSVLLYTERKLDTTGAVEKYEVYLWFSDGLRVRNAGLIATTSEYPDFIGLSYTNDGLFSLLYKTSVLSRDTIVLTCLKDKLGNIKSVLTTWTTNDGAIY